MVITQSTKQRLLDAGLPMLLKHGYSDLGLQALLAATNTPKGSFYHHFKDKEDFALQVVDVYMAEVHGVLDVCLNDKDQPPLVRIRNFFETVARRYQQEGYMGCLLGGLGQELSGISETFRRKIEECFGEIAGRLSRCLEEEQRTGQAALSYDARQLADLLVNCWEGAALRSRLQGDPSPLTAMLDFYMRSVYVA